MGFSNLKLYPHNDERDFPMIPVHDEFAIPKQSVRLIGGSMHGQVKELNYPFYESFGSISDSGLPNIVLVEDYAPHPIYEDTLFCQTTGLHLWNQERN